MPKSIKSDEHTVYRNVNDALQGDSILIECREKSGWSKARGSGQHHYFTAVVSKNAYAVIKKKSTNIKT